VNILAVIRVWVCIWAFRSNKTLHRGLFSLVMVGDRVGVRVRNKVRVRLRVRG
jgi:hypothetical protein